MNSTSDVSLEVVPDNYLLVERIGTDNIVYQVVLLSWSLENIERFSERFRQFKILSDEVQKTREGFEHFVLQSGAIWFETITKDAQESVGIMYIADFVRSSVENRYISASFHLSMWDSKISERMPVLREAVREIFKLFKLHRLEMEIPLYAGGAIRVAKKSGFVEEGVRREARRYHGKWWNVLHLAMLETEVPNG